MILAALLLSLPSPAYIDFDKNGRMDLYENPKAPVDRRIEDLPESMELTDATRTLSCLKRVATPAIEFASGADEDYEAE